MATPDEIARLRALHEVPIGILTTTAPKVALGGSAAYAVGLGS